MVWNAHRIRPVRTLLENQRDALLAFAAQPASGDARMQAVMRAKLANTQSLLKAIVTADYKEIDRAALALSRISEMEIVSWQNPPKPEYTKQAMLFMSSVDDLRQALERAFVR